MAPRRSVAATGRRTGPEAISDELLITAACATFAEQGYVKATMTEIARRAGISKPTLYAHFGAKDALYQRCMARETDALRNYLFTAYEGADSLQSNDATAVGITAIFEYAEHHADGFRLIFYSGSSDLPSAHQIALSDEVITRIAATMGHRMNQDPRGHIVRQLAAMVIGGAVLAVREAMREPARDLDVAAALACAYTLGGLHAAVQHLPQP